MKQQKLLTLILGLCLSLLLALPALAQVDDEGNDISLAEENFNADEGVFATDNGEDQPEFGNFDREVSSTASGSCTPIRSIYSYDQNFAWRWSTGGTEWFDCSGHIPQGAKLIFVGVEAYDIGGSNVALFADELDFLSSSYTTLASAETSGANTSRRYLVTSSFNRTINNLLNSYQARVRVGGGSLYQFRTVYFVYIRQLSPKPGFATFGDVPTSHPFHRAIEALYASRITVGCGGGNYCPNDFVTRGQMAVFLAKGLGLHWW
jgi:hypothetical protein